MKRLKCSQCGILAVHLRADASPPGNGVMIGAMTIHLGHPKCGE